MSSSRFGRIIFRESNGPRLWMKLWIAIAIDGILIAFGSVAMIQILEINVAMKIC
jgi:hypothetical protein